MLSKHFVFLNLTHSPADETEFFLILENEFHPSVPVWILTISPPAKWNEGAFRCEEELQVQVQHSCECCLCDDLTTFFDVEGCAFWWMSSEVLLYDELC